MIKSYFLCAGQLKLSSAHAYEFIIAPISVLGPTQSDAQWVLMGSFSEVLRPEREAAYPPLSSAEVCIDFSCISVPPYTSSRRGIRAEFPVHISFSLEAYHRCIRANLFRKQFNIHLCSRISRMISSE